MTRITLALLLFVSLPGPGAAATFAFTVVNGSAADIAKFFVRGGKIEGSTRVPSGGKSEVKVTLEDGKCRAEVRLDFADENYLDDDKVVDFCKYGALRIN